MPVFGAYSRYYNLLYREKDYAGEAEYVHGLIQRHCPGAVRVLDLGCGTGRHDLLLAEKGYGVTGVDLSEEMLAVARSQLPPSGGQAQPIFIQGDVRTVRLSRTFDVVISLFHVFSYQLTNDDLAAAFATVNTHLKPGGIFIFDCWYGPAVLTDRPAVRVKQLADETLAVTRIAEPVMYSNRNCVDVKYQIMIRDKGDAGVEELRETHAMRYLFQPEIELFLRHAGLDLIHAAEWMSDKQLGFDTWSGCFVASK